MDINLAETIRHLFDGIKDLGGLQILLVVLIIECFVFGWLLLLRHSAIVAHMKQATQTTIASMEAQRKLMVASLREQTKLMIASLEKQNELNRAVLEIKNEVERMALEQSEAQW